jgi:hypothetical protein
MFSDGMQLQAPMPEPKDITRHKSKGANEDETLLDEVLGCCEWDYSIDTDKLAHISCVHNAMVLLWFLDWQAFPWLVCRGIHVVEVCGDCDDTTCPKLYCSAYLHCNDEGAWWLAT